MVDQPNVKTSRIFHTRQLFCDVFMTVHRPLISHSLDILKLNSVSTLAQSSHVRTNSVVALGKRVGGIDVGLEQSLRAADEARHCMISVDVMNAYGAPFEIALESVDQSEYDKILFSRGEFLLIVP